MLTNNKSAVISNKNENVLSSDTKAVDLKVERSDDEVQQSEIGSYTYNVTKEEMAARHDMHQNVDRSNCSKETHSESRAETSEQSQNQNESIIKLETEAMSAIREEQIEELYADHDIKDEMVIGPVVVQAFPCIVEENGELFRKIPRLDTQDKTTEPNNTAKGTRTGTNTEEMTPKDCNENTEPSDTEPMENVTNKIPTKTSKPRNNTQKIRNDKNNKNVFQCNVCAKQYDNKADLAQHIECHDKTKRDIYFKCKECTHQSVTQCSLKRHLKLHDKSRRFVCDVCGYRYMGNKQLQEHLRNVHSDEKKHECGICEFKTNNIHKLHIHLRIHTGEKPYSCSLCEFKCSYKSSLKIHSRIHTGEKPYSCSLCEFKCSNKSSLKIHSRIHTGEKPYSGSECNYKCGTSSTLKQHLRRHSESLPKKPRLDTQDQNTEPDNTAKETRTETNTQEITPKEYNENTEPSDTKPIENVTNKIATKTSKPRNNTQRNIRNDKNNKRTSSIFQRNVKQYDKKPDLAQHIKSHDKTKRDIYFKCIECTHQSVTQCSLERHLKLHDKSRRFVCDVCGYRYMGNKQLQEHLSNVHSDEKKHECGICEFKTNNIHKLHIHLRIHTGAKPYSCSLCEFKCSYKSSLKIHSRIHTGEKPYSCSLCEFKCSNKSSLKIHSRIHTGEKPYSGSECNYKCGTSSTLKQHLRRHSELFRKIPRLDTQDKTTEPNNTAKGTRTETNTEEMTPKDCNENTEPSDTEPMESVTNKIPTKTSKPHNNTQKIRNDKNNKNVFQCNVCAKQYDNKADLAQHVESHDKTKRDTYFKCKECTYQSLTQCSLERHLKLHDKSRRFVCDVCGFRYMENAYLQQHLRNVHSDEKTLECGICDYRTNYISDLKVHLRIHTGEKPYSCSQCEFKSSRKGGLNMHSQIHTGEKPYSCSECNYKCTRSNHLKRHLRTHITETHPASHAETSEPSQNHNSNDRNGSIIKLETEAMSAVREEPTEELYADHEIKDEMVIGPVVLQAVTYMMEENGL